MRNKKINIFYRLSRAAVLVPYALFFAVQVFFNYDIAQPLTADFHHDSTINAGAVQRSSAPLLADKSKEKKTHFRLNKRFQPVGILSFHHASITPCVRYLTKDKIGDRVDPLMPSHHLFASTLRGPPAVA